MFKYLKLKKVWIPLLLVIIIVSWVVYSRGQNGKPQYKTETVGRQDLKQTVSVTGTVESAEQVELNFDLSGRLVSLPVKVGDKVKLGTRLAGLDSRSVQTVVLSAQATLQQAQASLAKLRAGSQVEDIAVSQAAVAAAATSLANAQQSLVNTTNTQSTNISNALAQLVGLPAMAVSPVSNNSSGTLTISGTYNGTELGSYIIKMDNSANLTYSVYGLEEISGISGSRVTSTLIGNRGLRVQFSSTGTFYAGDTWTIEIPNTASSSYAAYYAAYQAALSTQKQQVETAQATVRAAQEALAQVQAQLALKQAPARSYDISSAEASVRSAQASLERAQTDLSNRFITALTNGTVIKVNYQVGETTSPSLPVIIMQADGNFEIKVKVPESDIVKLLLGQVADITLDAFGSGEHFSGHISFIDPASTTIQDVVYYEITILFDNQDERIKSGMTANIDILTGSRENVLVVPLKAVKFTPEGNTYVEILDKDQLKRLDVVIGLKADDGLVEIKSGLQGGEAVITFKSNVTN